MENYYTRILSTYEHPRLGKVSISEFNPKYTVAAGLPALTKSQRCLCASISKTIEGHATPVVDLMTPWTVSSGSIKKAIDELDRMLEDLHKQRQPTPTSMSTAAPAMKANRDIDPDLSDLAGALNPNGREKTALELWNDVMEEVFINNAFVKRTKSGSAPVQLYYDRLLAAREALKHFEVTKHRIIVDAIIDSLKGLEVQHNSTHVLRFAKRMKLRARIEATKAALLVVVNTAPPKPVNVTMEEEPTKAKK